MKRLDPDEAAAALARAIPIPTHRPARVVHGPLRGIDVAGEPAAFPLAGTTLVVFCSTTCDGCRDLAGLVAEGAPGVVVVGAMRTPTTGLPDADVTAFTAGGGRWLLGDEAFVVLGVHAAPFFSIIDADGAVAVEGVALGRAHVESHVVDALAGTPRADAIWLTPEP